MTNFDYLKVLVEEIHSAVVATIDTDGKPITRVIDMMLYDEDGLYFLTAKGKTFYEQLMAQKYISLSAVKAKKSISLKGKVENLGSEKLEEIFRINTYMQKIYPKGTRDALEVFRLYNATGEYFDISEPEHVERGSITIGNAIGTKAGYYAGMDCIGCKLCYSACPQKCIDITNKPVEIQQNHCLHCGRCAEICPKQTIKKVG